MRTVSFDVPPQEILTKDSVTVAVDAVVYYKIEQPMSAVINVADYASRLNFCIYLSCSSLGLSSTMAKLKVILIECCTL